MKLLVFWRTGGTSWCCRVVVALVGLLLALPTLAQPSVQWQRYVGGDSTSETNHGTVRLSRTRFVTTGRWISTDFQTAYPLLVFTRSTGDTIRVIRLTTMPETSFSAIAAADSGDFYALGNSGYDSTFTILGGGTDIICRFDSLGRPKWRRFPVHPPGIGSAYYRVVPLPDGALIVATAPSVVPGQLVGAAELRRIDGRGRTRWVRQCTPNSSGVDVAALADGSYALLAIDPNRFPPPHSSSSLDHLVYQITPDGTTLRSAYVGDSGVWEVGVRLLATTDGGLVIIGRQMVKPYNTQPRRGTLFKLDTAWHEQWRYWFAPPTGNYQYGGETYDVAELVNGHYLLTGGHQTRAFLQEVAARGTAALWTWSPPALPGSPGPYARAAPMQLLPDTATGEWRVYGEGAAPGHTVVDIWYASLTNLPAAAAVNYCATPPGPPAASYQTAGTADTLRFTLDVATTDPGPRYAEISRVTWDFGDGTPPDTGRVVGHRYAAPTPVRVRCTITNNLFCTSTTELFPFGPVGLKEDAAALAATISVYPNPSASGRFTVRTVGGGPAPRATFSVTDAVGRTVAAGMLAGAETALDLSSYPAGVYALRLTWPDGWSVTKRLVRW